MNKTQKTGKLIRSPLIAIAASLLIRALLLVASAALAFASDDPAAFVDGAALAAKLISELIGGAIIAKAIGDDFNPLTRITLAAVISASINTCELLIGKAVCGGSPTGLITLPFAIAVCALGAALASKRKHVRKRKRSRR